MLYLVLDVSLFARLGLPHAIYDLYAMRSGLFVIDPKGSLRSILVNDMPIGRSVDEALRLVQACQHFDKNGEGTSQPSAELQVWSTSVWCSLQLQQTSHDMYTYDENAVITLYTGGRCVIFCTVCPANWKPGQDAMKVSEAGAYFKKHYWAEPSRALLLYKLHCFRFMALCRAQASQTRLIYNMHSLLFAPATRRASIGSALNILPFIVSSWCRNHLIL